MAEESADSGQAAEAKQHVHPVEHHTAAHEHAHTHQTHDAAVGKKHGKIGPFDAGYVKAAIAYLLISFVAFYPIILNISNVAPGVGGDTYQNLWDIWWVDYAVFTLHTSFYQTSLLFWPVGSNLVYQTMSPLFAIISAPFQLVSVPFAYNVMFLMGFVLSGLAMFTLADYIVGNRYAAFFAGVVFAFSAFHVAQSYSHIEWINLEWVPLAAYFIIRIVRGEGRMRSAVLLGVSMVLVFFMAGMELGIMTSLFLLFLLIAYFVNKDTRKQFFSLAIWEYIALAVVLAFVLGLWGFVPILQAVAQPGALQTVNNLNAPQYNQIWSDDILSFFLPSYYNGLFNGLATSVYSSVLGPDPTERSAYFGYVALALAAWGVYRSRAKTGQIRLWLVLGAIFFLLCLGPNLIVGGSVTTVPGLYSAYSIIPVLNIVREPGRFDVFVTIALAMLAAIGMKDLLDMPHRQGSVLGDRKVVLVCACALFLFESVGLPLSPAFVGAVTTQVYVPAVYYQLGKVSANYSVLNLPAVPDQNSPLPALYEGMSMYYMSKSRLPMVGGYVTRENTSQELTLLNIPLAVAATNLESTGVGSYPSPVNQSPTNVTLLSLFNYNTAIVVVNKAAYNYTDLSRLDSYLISLFGQPLYSDSVTDVFQTENAIALLKPFDGYVAYPMYYDWVPLQFQLINGTYQQFWTPVSQGKIVLFAPFVNSTDIASKLTSSALETINTTISFEAFSSYGPASLYIEQNSTGLTRGGVVLARINLTNVPTVYAINTTMASGLRGNNLFFVPQATGVFSNQTVVEIKDIRFLR